MEGDRIKYSLTLYESFLKRYRQLLPGHFLIPRSLPDSVSHANHLFVIRSPQRDALKEKLTEKGIETAIHYPAPIHFQPAFSRIKPQAGGYPVAELACREVLSIPLYPGLTAEDQDKVISEILSWK